MARNKDRKGPVNVASGNARVGLQVDGGVVITGGLFLGGSQAGRDSDGEPRGGDPGDAQGGTVNVASGSDTVAFQAGQVFGRVFGEDDDQ